MSWTNNPARMADGRSAERGYALLTLLLFVTLLAVAAATIAPSIAFQIKRDREEELIHRGVQYARAIRRYAKQTGRFPSRLEELQNSSSGRRYLRRLYKDPVTGEDFRPVYTADIATAAAKRKLLADENNQSENGDDLSHPAASSENHVPGEIIFGVVSKSKARTIREFDHREHYNEWLFFYDPNYDRGMEIKGPTSLIPTASLLPKEDNGPPQPAPHPTDNQQPATQAPLPPPPSEEQQ